MPASDKLEALGLAKDIEYLTNLRKAISQANQVLQVKVPEGMVFDTSGVQKDMEGVLEVLAGLDEELVDTIQDLNDEKDKKQGVEKKDDEKSEEKE